MKLKVSTRRDCPECQDEQCVNVRKAFMLLVRHVRWSEDWLDDALRLVTPWHEHSAATVQLAKRVENYRALPRLVMQAGFVKVPAEFDKLDWTLPLVAPFVECDIPRLRAAVESGEIMRIRGMGKKNRTMLCYGLDLPPVRGCESMRVDSERCPGCDRWGPVRWRDGQYKVACPDCEQSERVPAPQPEPVSPLLPPEWDRECSTIAFNFR